MLGYMVRHIDAM